MGDSMIAWCERIPALMSRPVGVNMGLSASACGASEGKACWNNTCFHFFHRKPWQKPFTFLTSCLKISTITLAIGIGRCGWWVVTQTVGVYVLSLALQMLSWLKGLCLWCIWENSLQKIACLFDHLLLLFRFWEKLLKWIFLIVTEG